MYFALKTNTNYTLFKRKQKTYNYLHNNIALQIRYRTKFKNKTEIINDVIEVSKIIGKEQKYNCVKMVDIGVYNSYPHFCKYCYANFFEEKVKDNFKLHNDKSSLLVRHITKDDITKVRK